jgi:hypothetical protein
LLATETDSSAYDHNGDALKKTTYVPFVYTLEEVLRLRMRMSRRS